MSTGTRLLNLLVHKIDICMRPTMNKALFHTLFFYTFSFLSISVFDSFQFSQFFFTLLAWPRISQSTKTPNEQPVERKLVSMGRLLTPLGREAVAKARKFRKLNFGGQKLNVPGRIWDFGGC